MNQSKFYGRHISIPPNRSGARSRPTDQPTTHRGTYIESVHLRGCLLRLRHRRAGSRPAGPNRTDIRVDVARDVVVVVSSGVIDLDASRVASE